MFSSPIGTAFAVLAFAVTASQAGPNVSTTGTVPSTSQSGYTLEDDYTPANFFKMFDFFNSPDPTHGFVQYVDQKTAQNGGLISSKANSVYIGVDHKAIASNGRASVRISSRKSYTRGLFIADIQHMPGGICGTWPAFWTVGPDWPNGGEIDIIEQVNDAATNKMTLHSSPGCVNHGDNQQAGHQTSADCNALINNNQGCSVSEPEKLSYGTDFNQGKGGAYAMEWTTEAINIWFWSRSRIPQNALSTKPDPSQWGRPSAKFHGGCDIAHKFQKHNIVFDTTFCGDWAGDVWSSSSCSKKAKSCTDYVANNPAAFAEAYWEVNSLKVFKHT